MSSENLKKCPFCAELIQLEATKCRYCNEWFTDNSKESKIGEFIHSSVNFAKEKVDSINEFRNSHLATPTDEQPLILNELELYDSYFIWCSKKYTYEDIGVIFYKNSIERVNGFKTRESIFSWVIIPKYKDRLSEEEDIPISMNYKPLLPILGDKKTEQIKFMVEFMRKKSFISRYERFKKEAEATGQYIIGGFGLRSNGDLILEDGVHANIVEACKNNLVEYGESWEGLKSSSRDPYTLIIYKSHKPIFKIFEIDLNTKIEIQTLANKDINDLVLKNIITKGSLF